MSDIKAVLFGLNYSDTSHQLNGCINDVILMKDCLIKFSGVKEENITVMTDNTTIRPTKVNILNELKNSIKIINSSDTLNKLWIHYSGHGSYITDFNGDENVDNDSHTFDGVDEVLCPLDGGYISDDQLNIMFSEIREDKELVCVFDCCHSGTALDLPYKYDYIENKVVHLNNANKIKCHAMLLSGCKDSQQSYDTPGLTNKPGYTYTGAFTTSILKALQHTSTTSLDNLIEYANDALVSRGIPQTPQITSNKLIDTKTSFMESHHRQKAIQKRQLYKRYCDQCDYWFTYTSNPIYQEYKEYFKNEIVKLTVI